MILIIINNNAYISILPISPSCSRRAHLSLEEEWNFSGKNCEKLECFCITKIMLGEISSSKKVSGTNLLK